MTPEGLVKARAALDVRHPARRRRSPQTRLPRPLTEHPIWHPEKAVIQMIKVLEIIDATGQDLGDVIKKARQARRGWSS